MAQKKSKKEAILGLLKQRPNAMPKDIAEALQKRGYEISAAYVSSVKHHEKTSDQRAPKAQEGDSSAGPQTASARAGAPKKRGRQGKGTVNVNIEALKGAKKFVDKIGSYEEAKALLEEIEGMGGITRTQTTIKVLEALSD